MTIEEDVIKERREKIKNIPKKKKKKKKARGNRNPDRGQHRLMSAETEFRTMLVVFQTS